MLVVTSNVREKDPQAVLDYRYEWAGKTNGQPRATKDWLALGETITSAVITVSPISEVTPLTVDSQSIVDDDTAVVVWLSGGVLGVTYEVLCHIVTNAGREEDLTMVLEMVNN